jgi:hypothetical protein
LRFGPCRAVGADRPDRGAPTARDRSRWRLTRPATPAISAWSCASGLTRTSRRTTAGGVRRLMAVPPGTPDMPVSQRTRKRIEGAFAWAGACRL